MPHSKQLNPHLIKRIKTKILLGTFLLACNACQSTKETKANQSTLSATFSKAKHIEIDRLENQKNVTLNPDQIEEISRSKTFKGLKAFPNQSVSVNFLSKYDSHPLSFEIRLQEIQSKKPLFILCGDESLKDQLSVQNAIDWVFIPSRQTMNYRFLAKGDFKDSFQLARTLYPNLRTRRCILVTNESSAQAAADLFLDKNLDFAAFIAPNSFDYDNLSQFEKTPFVSYKTASTSKQNEPFFEALNLQVAKRLKNRGNPFSQYTNDHVLSACSIASRLIEQKTSQKHTKTLDQNTRLETPLSQKPRLLDFFSNEKLFIIYQDSDADSKFLNLAARMAQSFSRMDFIGLPDMPAKIPMIKLSDFLKQKIESYDQKRLILITDVKHAPAGALKNLQEKSNVHLNKPFALTAYSTSYLSLKNTHIFSFIANDTEGLDTLFKHYQKATSLFADNNSTIWLKHNHPINTYTMEYELGFQDFHDSNARQETLFYFPNQNSAMWKRMAYEVLLEQSGLNQWIMKDFNIGKPPKRINLNNLSQILPKEQFVKIRLSGLAATAIAEKIFRGLQKHNEDKPCRGLDAHLRLQESLGFKTWHFKTLPEPCELLISLESLKALHPSERVLIDYEILPYNLQEMLSFKLLKDREAFSRQFLRIARLLEEELQNHKH